MASVEFTHVTKDFNTDVRAVDDLNLSIADGEFVVFVGPSGCGKTTALRMTAGLEAISSGDIAIDGRVVNAVPSAKRDIAMVFQNYALYPHMTVFENMAFGLQQQRVGKREVERRVREIAALLELETYLARKPRALSGGQRQRVAMGRAIVRSPSVFLMDEPLSNLDAKLRVQMRAEIRALQQKLRTTTIYVTHDQVEAMTMGDRVAVLRGGVLQQVAAPHELYHRPANIFVAEFIGSPAMNLLPATVDGSDLLVGTTRVHAPHWSGAGRLAGRLAVGVRPEDVEIGTGYGLPGRVLHVEDLGSEIVAHVEVDASGLEDAIGAVIDGQEPGVDPLPALSAKNAGRVVARLPGASRIAVGAAVNVTFDPTKAHLFDLRSGAAIPRTFAEPPDSAAMPPLGVPRVAQSNVP